MKVNVSQEDSGKASMDTKMRDRFQQRLSPQLFSSGKDRNIYSQCPTVTQIMIGFSFLYDVLIDPKQCCPYETWQVNQGVI